MRERGLKELVKVSEPLRGWRRQTAIPYFWPQEQDNWDRERGAERMGKAQKRCFLPPFCTKWWFAQGLPFLFVQCCLWWTNRIRVSHSYNTLQQAPLSCGSGGCELSRSPLLCTVLVGRLKEVGKCNRGEPVKLNDSFTCDPTLSHFSPQHSLSLFSLKTIYSLNNSYVLVLTSTN